MTVHTGPLYGERLTPTMADALTGAFPGIAIYGDRIRNRLDDAGTPWRDLAADMVTPATMGWSLAARARLPGLRDALDSTHPVAIALHTTLCAVSGSIPKPDPEIVDELEALGCEQAGHIVTCRGMPVPAGEEQVGYFVVLRWRPLYSPLADPARIYRGDDAYDAANVTDELQESILLVSTRIHRENLIHLQRTNLPLFLAVWMREARAAEALAEAAPADTLPPCYPRTRLHDPRRCLMIACDIMSEHERAFDLLHALRAQTGVVRDSVQAALKACTSMTAVSAIDGDTHCHVAAGVAHVRSLHPTMNAARPKRGGDAVFQAVRSGFEHAKVYGKRYRHVVWVMGQMPVRFFLGVEPAMLIAVALIQMRENLATHEGKFWLGVRGRSDACRDSLATRTMSLAVVVTGNICLPTARAMMHDDGLLRDRPWLHRHVPLLVRNPKLEEQLAKAAKRRDDRMMHRATATKVKTLPNAPGDQDDFKNSYAGARRRARLCSPAVGRPGWTQGFRFDAWRQPLAEVPFLRDCSRYIQFEPRYVVMRERWKRAIPAKAHGNSTRATVADLQTGLPRQHPFERVQDLFRPQFDEVQVADLVRGAEASDAARRREAYIHEIAPMLAALTAATDDPQLNVDRNSRDVRIAREGAWNA